MENEEVINSFPKLVFGVIERAICNKTFKYFNTYSGIKHEDVNIGDVIVTNHWLVNEIEKPLLVVKITDDNELVCCRPNIQLTDCIYLTIKL